MKGCELIRRLRVLARREGVRFWYDKSRGKGSHGTIIYGDRFAVLPDRQNELKVGTLHGILSALAVDMKRLE